MYSNCSILHTTKHIWMSTDIPQIGIFDQHSHSIKQLRLTDPWGHGNKPLSQRASSLWGSPPSCLPTQWALKWTDPLLWSGRTFFFSLMWLHHMTNRLCLDRTCHCITNQDGLLVTQRLIYSAPRTLGVLCLLIYCTITQHCFSPSIYTP